mgnify:CR=1 FL=1
MGVYERRIFPWINDRLTGHAQMVALRRELLAAAAGDVVEIGFGSGLNLPYYPRGVASLTAIEPNAGMLDRARGRLTTFGRPVSVINAPAERLSFGDGAFDTAVSTLVLCSVRDPLAVLRELRRVLKPEGRFLVLEHGRAPDGRVARWQDRLNGLQNIVACGCNLNRPVVPAVEMAGFQFERVRGFYLERAPKALAWMTLGVAVKV